ncbi:hypothetical protein GOP47_0011026 [Adiantum capillus-veneris]|uniref:Uncharacterized protein n=1 Tax=Adiantum capillus-veneris TaxID=13818 RepID=A0A9D4UWF8_ADICA|nr:hypothetical protein GOP47_0011026 [Adiantum capillus-veneris]
MSASALKLGKDQGADHIMSKENMKDGSKALLISSKSTKKQLPLPPSQHHQYQAMMTSSPSLPSLVAITSSTSASTSTALPITSMPLLSSSAAIPFPIGPSSSSSNLLLSGGTLSPMVLMREILNNIAMQRNQVLSLINSVDPSFLTGATHSKSVQEHKLLNQVAELQAKILDMTEEIQHMRAKNAQLEQQLSLFHGKRGA